MSGLSSASPSAVVTMSVTLEGQQDILYSDWVAWKEVIIASITNSATYQLQNVDYESSIPGYVTRDTSDALYDYQAHNPATCYFDDPYGESLDRYYTGMYVPVVRIRNIQNAIDLATGSLVGWREMLTPNIPPPEAEDEERSIIMSNSDEGDGFPTPEQLRHAIWDFSNFQKHNELSEKGSYVSVVLLALFLAMPNLETLHIHRYSALIMQSSTTNRPETFFAMFPSPLEYVYSCLDAIGVPSGFTVAPKLTALQFSHCDISTSDLFFFGDCAVHRKVFPLLKTIKLVYCKGISYSSILHVSPVINIIFDRYDYPFWWWPHDFSNNKNTNIHNVL